MLKMQITIYLVKKLVNDIHTGLSHTKDENAPTSPRRLPPSFASVKYSLNIN